MRILLIAEQYYPPTLGGSAITVRQLAIGLAARGHRVMVVAPSPTIRSAVEQHDGVTVLRAPSIPAFFVPNQAVRGYMRAPVFPGPTVERAFRRLKPEIVHTQLPALIGSSAASCAAERGIPMVATLHSLPENATGPVDQRTWLFRAVSAGFWESVQNHCRRAQTISAPSQLAANLLHEHGITEPIEVISNGVDLRRFQPARDRAAQADARRRLGWPETGPVILYVGRLASEKRIDVLLEAIGKLPADLGAQAVLVGKGDDTYPALAEQLGVAGRCRFAGPISDEDLPLVYQASDVFAFPSEAELQGMVLLEAAASGLPLVGADHYAIPEIIHHGLNGYLHTPGDAASCAAAIARVLSSDRAYARMQTFAIRFAAEHDLTAVAARTERLYEETIARPRRYRRSA